MIPSNRTPRFMSIPPPEYLNVPIPHPLDDVRVPLEGLEHIFNAICSRRYWLLMNRNRIQQISQEKYDILQKVYYDRKVSALCNWLQTMVHPRRPILIELVVCVDQLYTEHFPIGNTIFSGLPLMSTNPTSYHPNATGFASRQPPPQPHNG